MKSDPDELGDGRLALVQCVPRGHRIEARMRELELAFWARGYEVHAFAYEDLRAGACDAYLQRERPAIVLGHIAAVHSGLERAGFAAPRFETLPASLRGFLGRKVWASTLGEIRRELQAHPERFPLHVKPKEDERLFSGVLVEGFQSLIPSAAAPSEAPVWVQAPVALRSEWRAYVLGERILRVANYRGDPLAFPDPAVIEAGVQAYREAPAAYGIDWAVSEEGQTHLIEVNDACALGNYGLLPNELASLYEARWEELTTRP